MNLHDDYSTDFFEGTEKLLEVWFTRRDGDLDNEKCNLRLIPRSTWETLLTLVKCEIISHRSNDHIDAYVLSESSMFVSKRRFILKTCGSTTLLKAMDGLLFVVQSLTGFDEVENIFYSRKNYMRPELQDKPHTSFEEEVRVLDELFDSGCAYCLGSINRDCWYLYTLQGPTRPTRVEFPSGDQTLEVLMQDLDQDVMSIFTQRVSASAADATKRSGIDKLYPGAVIDDFLFSPCGYSMNGIIKGDTYFTIHITPEPHCSYVSFETNANHESYHGIIAHVLRIFKPGKFVTTLFTSKTHPKSTISVGGLNGGKDGTTNEFEFAGFTRRELQVCHFDDYDLHYGLFFAKAPS